MNGNREIRNIIKITHWNMGSKKWEKKLTEVDALILEKSPDLLFLSEANLYKSLPENLRQVEGYSLHLPLTMNKHHYSRIVLLVKNGVTVKIHPELMHEDLAVIWCSVMSGNKSVLKLGGVYREHRHLLKPKPNLSKTDQAQLDRWNLLLTGWKLAAKSKNCLLIGDFNLDYSRWNNAEGAQKKMIQRTKEEMEPLGFVQVISNITRTWHGQADSIIDHCWLNSPQKLISHQNQFRGSSDHNMISVVMRSKDKITNPQVIRKRIWKNFSLASYREEVSLHRLDPPH